MRMPDGWLEDRIKRTGLGAKDNTTGKPVQAAGKPKRKKQKAAQQAPVRRHQHSVTEDGVHCLTVKPLSANEAWQGQRFKTPEYKAYEQECQIVLPAKIEIPDGPLEVFFEWGFSNSGSDNDNPTKLFQDILQKQYGFNDSLITDTHLSKRMVAKGQEYIKFKIRRSRLKSIFDL